MRSHRLLALAALALAAAPALADSAAQVADINPGPARGVNEARKNSAVFGGQLYIAAQGNNGNVQLWRYDGVSPPTVAAAINPTGSSFPGALVAFGDRLCFAASDASADRELYCYDGSNPPLKINVRSVGSSNPTPLVVFQGQLYFSADGDASGRELWRYDGVHAPERVTDLAPGSASGLFTELWDDPIVWQGQLYFIANDGTFDDEVYRYDGVDPPEKISDSDGHADSGASLAVAGDHLYFAHTDSGGHSRLWQYDGVEPPIQLSPTLEVHGPFATFEGDLDLWAKETAPGSETGIVLWRYDGAALSNQSPGGDFGVGGASSRQVFAGALYFIAANGLYRYDGTGAPQFAVTFTGLTDYPENGFEEFAGRLFFAARNDSGGGGEELWALTPSVPVLFRDGFEKHGLTLWSAVSGLD